MNNSPTTVEIAYWIVSIIAIIIGPIVAVQVQKFLERNRSAFNHKEEVFKILMATRGNPLSKEHVEALNRIEIEFGNQKRFVKVIDSWKTYFDHLCISATGESAQTQWNINKVELHTDLLYQMSLSLRYNFDKIAIKRNVYQPVLFEKLQEEQQEIKDLVKNVLNGNQGITVTIKE
ncbi:MAG: hypothetical protein HKK66_05855 [Chlorobiaceae bacterium]|nr:hypothetical protein [Chlorobiaceae bacterium]